MSRRFLLLPRKYIGIVCELQPLLTVRLRHSPSRPAMKLLKIHLGCLLPAELCSDASAFHVHWYFRSILWLSVEHSLETFITPMWFLLRTLASSHAHTLVIWPF